MSTQTITAEEEKRYAELQVMALDAARRGDNDTLRPMLEAGMPVNLQDEKGNTLLMLASYHGATESVRLLLSHGADPDRRNDREQTPLGGVAFKGHLEIAKALVEHGADPNASQGGGQTPIMFAALFGREDVVRYLKTVLPKRKKSWLSNLGMGLLVKTTAFIRRLATRNKAKALSAEAKGVTQHAPTKYIGAHY